MAGRWNLVERNGLPQLETLADSVFDGRWVLPVKEVDVEGRGCKEELQLRAAELRSCPKARGESGESARVIPVDDEGRSEMGIKIRRPKKGGSRREGATSSGGREEVESTEEDVLLGRDGADEVVAAGEEGVGAELEVEGCGAGGGEE